MTFDTKVSAGNILTVVLIVISVMVSALRLSAQFSGEMAVLTTEISLLQSHSDEQSVMIRQLQERLSYIEGKIGAASIPYDPPPKKLPGRR